jgi:F0F1-type ATP synthase assembly protein I
MLTWINLVAEGLPQTYPGRPLRVVLGLQFLATFGISSVAGLWIGADGAVSAILGGMVMMVACCVYAALTAGKNVRSAGEILRVLIRAEAAKIGVVVLQLWLVLTAFENVVPGVFICTFIVAVLIYPIALLIRD